MKAALLVFALSAAVVGANAEDASQAAPSEASKPAPKPYREFIAQLFTRGALAELATVSDRTIDSAELPRNEQAMPGPQAGETKTGLRVEFGIVTGEQAILYHLSVSRKGQELRFSDAAKVVSFVAERAGLPHPITIKEGEKPVFYAQWLFKPSDWKAERKLMLAVRAENRAEKDALKAFAVAVSREIEARQRSKQ